MSSRSNGVTNVELSFTRISRVSPSPASSASLTPRARPARAPGSAATISASAWVATWMFSPARVNSGKKPCSTGRSRNAMGANAIAYRSSERLHDRRAERGEVAGVAARDQRAIGGDLLVHRLAARVADVGAQARERG